MSSREKVRTISLNSPNLFLLNNDELWGRGSAGDHTDDTLDLESHHQDDRDREP